MRKTSLIDRQVHLDFHTSEHIIGIGSQFDEDKFVEALKVGHIAAINLFGICHHGWAYYDSKLGYKHPHLQTNLLERQMAACHKAGVRPVVYNTVRWNARVARMHPEWTVREKDGSSCGALPHPHSELPMYAWNTLCLNSPYIEEYVLPSTEEIMTLLKPSGMFMDITFAHVCYCDYCKEKATGLGLDTDSDEDMKTLADVSKKDYREKVAKLVWKIDRKATLFHNDHQMRREHEADSFRSHCEIESLPTGFWGYDHFPCNAAYFDQLKDSEVVGMTGKFHTSWGEFGGFKHPNALRWESAQIASYGCLTCIGHHLHPTGEIDLDSFRLIGESFKELEERQEWLKNSRNAAEVAVLITENRLTDAEIGACKMLLEAQVPFAVVDPDMDWSAFKVLLLPDELLLDLKLSQALKSFQEKGGKLLASGFSGLDSEKRKFLVNLGVTYKGESPWNIEYIQSTDTGLLASGISDPFLVYHSGAVVSRKSGKELAKTWQPYFNRAAARYSGHRDAPYEKPSGSPSVVVTRKAGYISQRIFQSYHKWGTRLYRELVIGVLKKLLPTPKIEVDLPSAGRVALRQQAKPNRHILHLLYATPIQRGSIGVIEDIVPIHDVSIALRLEKRPKSIRLVPQGESIPFKQNGELTRFTLPKLELSQLVEIT